MNTKFTFIFDIETIEKSILITKSFLDDLKKSGMYYYFPFTAEQLLDKDQVLKIIQQDIDKNNITLKKEELENFWDIKKEKIIDIINDFSVEKNLTLLPEYFCVLTPYGPYGYYHTPNIIFLNTNKGETEFVIETALHEFLHLLLFETLSVMSDEGAEKLVDATFVKLFGEMFPNYKVQDF